MTADVPFIPYGRQWLDDDDIRAVQDVLASGWLTCGPRVAEFESRLAETCGAAHAVAVSSGTAALHVAMLAARVGPGDRVVTSPNTFLASANCAAFTGATPDFIDIDEQTLNMDPGELAANWSEDIRAVIPVDFAGRPCDMPRIAEIARARGALVVEDASHALGTEFEADSTTYRAGGHPWADMTVFSFHPVKTVTCGEGGAVVTDDPQLAERCRLFRNHGMDRDTESASEAGPWVYEMHEVGFNYRITDIQCALGTSQLSKLDRFKSRRAEIVAGYNAAFAGVAHVTPPPPAPAARPCWHLYVVRIDFASLGKTRSQVMAELRALGIGTQVHYIPVHLQPFYRNTYGYGPGKCPRAEAYYEECLSLPLYPSMSDGDVDRVVSAVSAVVGDTGGS